MTEVDFNAGDVVRLKSGGPWMTVDRIGCKIEGKEAVLCRWFDESKIENSFFRLETIEKSTKEIKQ